MDHETRCQLWDVLLHLQESEARRYYQQAPEDRKGSVYDKALILMKAFEFDDLLLADLQYRSPAERVTPASPEGGSVPLL
jgi:hypothetical protein